MKKNVYYSEEMKQMVIEQVLSGDLSMSQAQRRSKIGKNCTDLSRNRIPGLL